MITEKVLAALIGVLERRYFQRRWIVQELYHSAGNSIFLLLGQHSTTVSELVASIDCFCGAVEGLKIIYGKRHPDGCRIIKYAGWNSSPNDVGRLVALNGVVINLIGLERSIQREIELAGPVFAPLPPVSVVLIHKIFEDGREGHWNEFVTSLHACSPMDCKDPRDRIYALHSLLEGYSTFEPDYSCTVDEAYLNAAGAIIKEGFLKTILNDACFQRTSEPQSSLRQPSWGLILVWHYPV